MSNTNVIQQDIINEIGTQTLARFGLNIFALRTYEAYGASAQATDLTSSVYQQHKNNPNAFGQSFEQIDVGQKNINAQLLGTGSRTYTTDEIADIKTVGGMIQDGKKYSNLTAKDQAKFDRVLHNYKQEEINSICDNPKLQDIHKNDPSTDTITLNYAQEIIQRSQHKAIKNTKDLLKDRYLENNDIFTVPFDDYKRHKDNLEEMIANPNLDAQKREKAQTALTMLNKNNLINRACCEHPRATVIAQQTAMAGLHIGQAGLSDAVVVSLSTLANGSIWEIRDIYNNDTPNVLFTNRVKRLLEKVITEFKGAFCRGAGFGALDVGVTILSQIFKSISGKIKRLWKELRTAAKSIYNAIYSYIKGEIKSYRELISSILKGLISATLVVGMLSLESQLEVFLAPITTPLVASFLAPALSIIVGSIAVVLTMKSVDAALNGIFGVFAQRDQSRIRLEEITKICSDALPKLISQQEDLQKLIDQTYAERRLDLEQSFASFSNSLNEQSSVSLLQGLQQINELYGTSLPFKSQDDFDQFMLSDEAFEL